MKQWWKSSK